MKEIFKKIPDYEKYYLISNMGNVKTINGEIVEQKNQHGYKIVYLKNKIFSRPIQVHRLVAITFIKNPDNKPIINHIDGNKQNNNVKNLEWCTESENRKHAVKNGLFNPTFANKKIKKYDLNGNFIKEYESIKSACEDINISRQRFYELYKKKNGIIKNFKYKK